MNKGLSRRAFLGLGATAAAAAGVAGLAGCAPQQSGTASSGSDSAALLEEYTEMAIITFADEADMQAFYNTIPYEQHWYPRTLANDFQPVCDGVTGSVWLEQTLGFHREAEYEYFHYEFPNGESATSGEVDHGLCAK